MDHTDLMKEYQQKLEGIYRKNYTVATPLLQAYDKQHVPFDSIDLRLQTLNHMDREGSIIPKENLAYISNQLSSISANYTLEQQESFLRNEGRGLEMEQKSIGIKVPSRVNESKKCMEQERSY
ncbi:hypothetical protein [Listeria seeligeri]|uniref:Uncharacterized protein n=1 Tax=Listeria seeligeri TaxID=1640 RepID=A0A7T0Q996_LISSE|nr:hypothetical protein [Listeria seeligeri]MBC1917049.1 hypothetical protein [Listeria seeligeri]MBC1990392.1 hypothetical protein [Listeria seeligeri]MBF2375205.1 hypothetical protein [Listeria seeligeri]QPL19414.1 hypothetical protein pLIS400396c [Listeria seeligeri]UCK61876.1 hypothetical protein pLIS51_00356c [Listeria seeligeri]